MRRPRLSIVTPTRHAPHLLDRLYNSLINQTCPEFDHVLVDTSTDNRTHERWCRDFVPHLDHRFRYARISLPMPDMAAAFEYAFTQATGDYVCPMTHKAMWRPDAIENIHRILDRYPAIHSFAFKSLYCHNDLHSHDGDFRHMIHVEFGSDWDGSDPTVYESRALFLENFALFGESGYYGPHERVHLKSPFSSHAIFSRQLLDRVQDRFGTIVAGRFAGDSRLGYRVMDLEGEIYQFPDFEPRVSSMHANTGAAGSQLTSWRYLCKVFDTLSSDIKRVISLSPFGYLPLWSVLNCWELYSVVDEAKGFLQIPIEFEVKKFLDFLPLEINRLTEIEEPVRAGLLRQSEALAARCEGGVLRKWF
jgi:glycosyltransferase involved in cell wall biosynthesis